MGRPYLRSGWLVSRVIAPILIRLRLVPTLVGRGRCTGQWRRAPVNVFELSGERYLVASRDNTQLVRNSRAAGEGRLQRGSRVETFEPDRERPEV